MPNNLHILITGASGFLGRYVVNEALLRGHKVRATTRSGNSWQEHPNLEIKQLDLLNQESILPSLDGVDLVIHLAASKTGDWETQYANTVTATENLLMAMSQASLTRLIAISSFSVYDYLRIRRRTTLDENSPLEATPESRDVYAQMKLKQEQLIQDWQRKNNGDVTILRPGIIYGKDNLWHASLGIDKSDKLWILINSVSQMPLNYVENCAQAIVLAAETEGSIGQVINLIDDDLPTQSTYVEKIWPYLSVQPKTIRLNASFVRFLTNLAWQTNQLLLKNKKLVPSLFCPNIFEARFKPLKYNNSRAKSILNWQPRYTLNTALEQIAKL